MKYSVTLAPSFEKKLPLYRQVAEYRIDDIVLALCQALSKNPFELGTNIPSKPEWPYGVYRVLRTSTRSLGRFVPFDVVYRVTDDHVELISIRGPIL